MAAVILEKEKFEITLNRLCFELIENHDDFSNTALIGLQPRGSFLANSLFQRLASITGKADILRGNLDITFYRDDFRRRENPLLPQSQNMDFIVEHKKIVLIDDVLYTGRTVRAALDALGAFGRPSKVELLVLVDRRFSRQLPIEADYTGIIVDTRASQKVKVDWEEVDGKNIVWLLDMEEITA